jgi:hypothetical protein
VRLTEVFRQAGESAIVRNAHAINAGRMPVCAPDSDFQFETIDDADADGADVWSFVPDPAGEGYDVLGCAGAVTDASAGAAVLTI